MGVVVTARRWLGGCRRTLTSGKARRRPLVASAGGAWVEGGTAPGLVGGLRGNKGSPKSRASPFSLCSFSSSGTGLPRFPMWERLHPRQSCQVYPRTGHQEGARASCRVCTLPATATSIFLSFLLAHFCLLSCSRTFRSVWGCRAFPGSEDGVIFGQVTKLNVSTSPP